MKRRVLIVTEATYQHIRQALAYCIESAGQADYDGDHNEQDARGFERALAAIAQAPTRDIAKDATAIRHGAEILTDQCSCVDRVHRDPEDHDVGCWYLLYKRRITRLRDLADILVGATPKLVTAKPE